MFRRYCTPSPTKWNPKSPKNNANSMFPPFLKIHRQIMENLGKQNNLGKNSWSSIFAQTHENWKSSDQHIAKKQTTKQLEHSRLTTKSFAPVRASKLKYWSNWFHSKARKQNSPRERFLMPLICSILRFFYWEQSDILKQSIWRQPDPPASRA